MKTILNVLNCPIKNSMTHTAPSQTGSYYIYWEKLEILAMRILFFLLDCGISGGLIFANIYLTHRIIKFDAFYLILLIWCNFTTREVIYLPQKLFFFGSGKWRINSFGNKYISSGFSVSYPLPDKQQMPKRHLKGLKFPREE